MMKNKDASSILYIIFTAVLCYGTGVVAMGSYILFNLEHPFFGVLVGIVALNSFYEILTKRVKLITKDKEHAENKDS